MCKRIVIISIFFVLFITNIFSQSFVISDIKFSEDTSVAIKQYALENTLGKILNIRIFDNAIKLETKIKNFNYTYYKVNDSTYEYVHNREKIILKLNKVFGYIKSISLINYFDEGDWDREKNDWINHKILTGWEIIAKRK